MSRILQDKIITVVGGSGYLGSAIARLAAHNGALVYCITRAGQPKNPISSKPNKNIIFYKGDAMQPEQFKHILYNSDSVIHTIGTLFDSTLFSSQKPGSPGSYEQMNRDCAIKVGNQLAEFKEKRKMVFVSATGYPPFLKRYITTKEEAEKELLSNSQLNTTVLKPGFIYSWNQKKISAILKYEIDLWNVSFGWVYKNLIPKNSFMADISKNFLVEKSIPLQTVCAAALVSTICPNFDGKTLNNDDMIKSIEKFKSYGLALTGN